MTRSARASWVAVFVAVAGVVTGCNPAGCMFGNPPPGGGSYGEDCYPSAGYEASAFCDTDICLTDVLPDGGIPYCSVECDPDGGGNVCTDQDCVLLGVDGRWYCDPRP